MSGGNGHAAIRRAMAARPVRAMHLRWHTVREKWLRMSPAQREAFVARFGKAWVPNPSLDEARRPIRHNGSGRDFLYMHRLMVRDVQKLLEKNGGEPLATWEALPRSDDEEYPALTAWNLPVETYPGKCAAVWDALVEEAEDLLSDARLRGMEIDELGSRLEYGVHNAMHQRFGGFSPGLGLRSVPGDDFDEVHPKWDDERYDSLLDPYSAHVNPMFWSIHLWVDRQIDRWEAATGREADWTDAWIGPGHHHHGDDDHHHDHPHHGHVHG